MLMAHMLGAIQGLMTEERKEEEDGGESAHKDSNPACLTYNDLNQEHLLHAGECPKQAGFHLLTVGFSHICLFLPLCDQSHNVSCLCRRSKGFRNEIVTHVHTLLFQPLYLQLG